MRKPTDPRKHGLKEPEKFITKNEILSLPTLNDTGRFERKYPLETTVNMWLKALKDHNSQGHTIVESPYLDGSGFLRYAYQYENLHYNEDMACYSAALNEYAEDCRKFALYEEAQKNKVEMKIDEKIERTERRLANLRAIKNKEPLPFPEGSDAP